MVRKVAVMTLCRCIFSL